MSFVLAVAASLWWHLPASSPGARWVYPLDGATAVVRGFDPPPELQPWRRGNRGVDLAAPIGAPVRAAGPGLVTFAGPLAGRDVVVIAHPGGLRTTYEPVQPTVTAGQTVVAGQPIGHLQPGTRRCPPQTCLHWGLLRGGRYLDPMLLLGGAATVRLLPWVGTDPRPGGPARARAPVAEAAEPTGATIAPLVVPAGTTDGPPGGPPGAPPVGPSAGPLYGAGVAVAALSSMLLLRHARRRR